MCCPEPRLHTSEEARQFNVRTLEVSNIHRSIIDCGRDGGVVSPAGAAASRGRQHRRSCGSATGSDRGPSTADGFYSDYSASSRSSRLTSAAWAGGSS